MRRLEPGQLSERQREVLTLLAEGLSNQDIADRLYVDRKTVAKHLWLAYRTIGVNTRTAAVVRVMRGEI